MTSSRFARMLSAALAVLATLIALTPAQARTHRSGWARAAFVASHPCPATGRPGACPGYVVDHIRPLCAGGADRPHNMAWQRRAEAVRKDRVERAWCLASKPHGAKRQAHRAQCADPACARTATAGGCAKPAKRKRAHHPRRR